MRTIELSNGELVLVDRSCFEDVIKYKWFKHSGGYAFTKHDGRFLYMHRLINNTPDGMITDHINGNKLDNRRSNLRTCTSSQNMYNSDRKRGAIKYRGVTKYKTSGKFQSRIKIDGYHKHLGLFDTEEEAALTYNLAAEEHHGEFAKLNKGITQQLTIFDYLNYV